MLYSWGMQSFLYGIFNSLSYTAFVGMEIYLAFLLVAFLIAVFISGFKCDYNLKKRAWFFIYSVGITLIFAGFTVVMKESVGVIIIATGLAVLFNMPIIFIRVKTKVEPQAPRELIRLIDREIRSPEVYENPKPLEVKNQTPSEKGLGIDFSHVKSVIERLEYYPLSPNDKRQVKELVGAVYSAENGVATKEIKEKINDGLGALLKIMSKYGV